MPSHKLVYSKLPFVNGASVTFDNFFGYASLMKEM